MLFRIKLFCRQLIKQQAYLYFGQTNSLRKFSLLLPPSPEQVCVCVCAQILVILIDAPYLSDYVLIVRCISTWDLSAIVLIAHRVLIARSIYLVRYPGQDEPDSVSKAFCAV